MYKVIGVEQAEEFFFPDLPRWTPEIQNEKPEEGFRQVIAKRVQHGDTLVATDPEFSERIRQILELDIATFWKEKWSNWERYGGPYYDQPIGSVEGQEVWLLVESVWIIFSENLSREDAIRRMCNPEDGLSFSTSPFGSANWTEFAEKFGREIFHGTDQEDQFEEWYERGWEKFKRTVDEIVEVYREGGEKVESA